MQPDHSTLLDHSTFSHRVLEAWNQRTVWTPERVAQQGGGHNPSNFASAPPIGQYKPQFPESSQKVDVVAQIVSKYTGVPLRALLGSRMHGTAEARWLLYTLLLDGAGLPPHKIKSMMNQRILVPKNLNAARAQYCLP